MHNSDDAESIEALKTSLEQFVSTAPAETASRSVTGAFCSFCCQSPTRKYVYEALKHDLDDAESMEAQSRRHKSALCLRLQQKQCLGMLQGRPVVKYAKVLCVSMLIQSIKARFR